MSPNMHEYPMLMNYLQLVSELPWNKTSTEVIDIKAARQVRRFNDLIIVRKDFTACD